MQDLTVTIIQSYLHWEDRKANLKQFSEFLKQAPATSLMILPEMFNTAFVAEPHRVAERMDGPTVTWMRDAAAAGNFVVTGSLIIEEEGSYYNRLVWMRPDGSLQHYDKKHLFRMGGEHKDFTAGSGRNIIDLGGWKVCPLVCYDLRFPAWSRNSYDNGEYAYDLLVYVANWPEARAYAWKTLLAARAMENQAYVIGVNRVGKDGRGIDYSGDSRILDMTGRPVTELQKGAIRMVTEKLDATALQENRERFQVALDWDRITGME